jgi:hypothetical protein
VDADAEDRGIAATTDPVVRDVKPQSAQQIELNARTHREVRLGVGRRSGDPGDVDPWRDPGLDADHGGGNLGGESETDGEMPDFVGIKLGVPRAGLELICAGNEGTA